MKTTLVSQVDWDEGHSVRTERWLRRGGAAVVLGLLCALAASALWMARDTPARRAAVSAQPFAAGVAPPSQRLQQQLLQFEPNRGQAARAVRFVSQGPRHRIEVFDDGVSLSARRSPADPASSAQLRLVGVREGAPIEAREPASSFSNYLRGADPAAWLRGVPRYRQLRQADAYPGIDLVYYSRDGAFEFDWVVKPGADPSRIEMQVAGAAIPAIGPDGDLLLDGPEGSLRLHRPALYQNIDGRRVALEGRYVLRDRRLRIEVPSFDRRYPLVIDPVLKTLYSTYLGGVHDDQVGGMAMDAQGNAYVIGNSGSEDWPVSANAVQTGRKALGSYVRNLVVTKFDPSGTLIYSTFLGGSVNDYGNAIAVDARGNAYLAGYTLSPDFPVTANAYQASFRGSQSAYFAVLSPDGSALSYSTFLGGSGGSSAAALVLDANGSAVIGGTAGVGLPTTAGAYKTTLATGSGAFVAKFSSAATGAPQLLASSYYGVDNPEANSSLQGLALLGLTVDASGAPWFTGQAYTTRLPLTAGAVQAAPPSVSPSCAAGPGPLNGFAFVAKLSADLGSLGYASYLSGRTEPSGGTSCSEFGRAVVVDAAGDVYISGGTPSASFPTTVGAAQPTLPTGSGFGAYSGFLTKLKGDGSAIVWSTYFGGNVGSTFPGASLVADAAGSAIWLGALSGGGSNFPITTDALQSAYGGGATDAVIARFDATTGALQYSSYFGGSGADAALALALDSRGNAFVAGTTTSSNFPVTTSAYQSALAPFAFDGSDWFFAILGSGAIGNVTPAVGGTGGDAALSITGVGFQAGASCALLGAGGTTLAAIDTTVRADGTLMTCTFPLAGAAVGGYDVRVTNPDGTTLTRRAGFTVAAAGAPDIEVDVIGPSTLRTGSPSDYQISIRNAGAVNAYMVPVWITLSKNLSYKIESVSNDPYLPSFSIDDGTSEYADPDSANALEGRRIPIIIPRVPAGYTGALRVRLTDVVGDDDFQVGVSAERPWFKSLTEARAALTLASNANVAATAGCVDAPDTAAVSNCFGLWADLLSQSIAQLVPALPTQDGSPPPSAATAVVGLQKLMAASLLQALDVPGSAQGASAVQPVRTRVLANGGKMHRQDGGTAVGLIGGAIFSIGYFAFQFVALGAQGDICTGIGSRLIPAVISYTQSKPTVNLGKCSPGQSTTTLTMTFNCSSGPITYSSPVKCPPDPPKPKKHKKGKGKHSNDPNDKFGPDGGGDLHALHGDAPFTYRVGFENKATAGLAAATVVVSDQLDASKVDLSTLTLGSISWGTNRIDVPPGLKSFATTYAVDSSHSVRVQGSLDSSTGLLKWTLATIDPTTRLPPSDPTIGFLPPDVDGVQGQGYVTFSVTPIAGLAEGTQISNQASIVFDANAAIATPIWSNTIDRTAPSSKVQSAAFEADGASVDVSWSGSDTVSGVAGYDVYVSDNGGAFVRWLGNATVTSAVYPGAAGHTYGFYAIATDGAGNVEAAKASAEAVTAPVAAGSGGASSGGGGGCTIAAADQRDATLPLLLLAALLIAWRRRAVARQGTRAEAIRQNDAT